MSLTQANHYAKCYSDNKPGRHIYRLSEGRGHLLSFLVFESAFSHVSEPQIVLEGAIAVVIKNPYNYFRRCCNSNHGVDAAWHNVYDFKTKMDQDLLVYNRS